MHNKFIALDGCEGSGKTTQVAMLAEYLKGIIVRDPGSTQIGEMIRAILLSPSYTKMQMQTEVMLFMAARAQMMAEIIKPALDADRYVVSDRFISSTYAYQQGISMQTCIDMGAWATQSAMPVLTLILDLPVSKAMARVKGKFGDQKVLDRFEQRGLDFHESVRNRYRNLAARYPEHFVVVDVEDTSVEDVYSQILSLLKFKRII